MGEDDEDVLARFSTADRINEGLDDVGMVHVEITAENTPEDSLKGGDADSVEGTGDESGWDRSVVDYRRER
jgi:hypothetical protein